MRYFIAIICTLAGSFAHAAESAKPNILFIFADDQSYKTVGCYPESWPWVKTPHIDALAKVRCALSRGIPRRLVHAVAGLDAHRPPAARHPVDADGRAVSRQHL